MAEECRYYYYDSGYSCELKREKDGNSSIDDDTVHKYCWGYNYERCPLYKSAQSSGCFLTSACVEAKGLSDNCYELTTLRAFRDNYLKSRESGAADICKYYHIAPIIVEKIKLLPNSLDIFEKIFSELVKPCIELIESGKNEEAYIKYKNYTVLLEKLYVKGV